MAPVAAHHAGMTSHGDGERTGQLAQHAPGGCPEHDQHEGTGAAQCALVAHCSPALLTVASVAPVPRVRVLAPPIALSDSRPLDATYQPEAPPPKV